MNIVLTGFMASGKSTIGKEIANISELKFIDTDEMIIQETGMTVNEIFEISGEKGFRELENELVKKIADWDGYVIATGGGLPTNRENIRILRHNGIIINLAPDFEVVKSRILCDSERLSRPLLKNTDLEKTEKLFNERIQYYRDCDFQMRVTNDKKPEYYAKEILSYL